MQTFFIDKFNKNMNTWMATFTMQFASFKEAQEWATLLVHVKTPTLDVMAWVNHDDTHFQYINSSTEISGEIIGRWKPTNQVAIVGYKTV